MTSLRVGTALRQSLSRSVATFRRELSTLVPLEDEFPGLPSLSPETAKASTASVTTLPSGLVVVTEDACATSTVTMTYPKAGSGEEMLDEQGAALVNKCLAFSSGSDMSTRFIWRSIESEGGTPFVSADRLGATLGYTVSKDKATSCLKALAVDCSFEKWDVRDAKELAAIETEEAGTSAQIVLTENLFAAAYGPQSPAGRTFYSYSVPSDLVQSFRARGYGLKGAVLTATGVSDHAAFCAEVSETLADAPAGTDDAPTPFSYLGGESRVAAPSAGFAHVALAFQGAPTTVLSNVIKHAFSVVGAEAGVAGFATPGLIGVYAGSDEAAGLVDSMTAVLTTKLTPDVIARAKALAKAEAAFALDAGSKSLAASMAATVLETGSFSGAADLIAAYDAVTEGQVANAVTAILKSNPSLAAVGDIGMVPYHATVAAQFA